MNYLTLENLTLAGFSVEAQLSVKTGKLPPEKVNAPSLCNPSFALGLTEAKDIKKRWQEYTEELYRQYLHDPHNHDGVITHLEPDILRVRWVHR